MLIKKVCVITGTRAEFGQLKGVMEGIQKSKILGLQVVVTGMHLSPEFGMTVNTIVNEGIKVNRRVEMLLSSDSSVGLTKSIGLGVIGFADALEELKPDLILILGDRYEILAAAVAAMVARIPIAHIHGGESTEGVIDESIRHSLSKMSHLHFVATEEYGKRVSQLGENPDNIYNVGGLGVDSLQNIKLLSKAELEKVLGYSFLKKNLLITFHPVTLEKDTVAPQMDHLLAALSLLNDVGLIFTMPNSDTDGRVLQNKVKDFCSNRPHANFYTSLGQVKYLSCMKHVDGVVGNSSSGIAEAPSFKKGTIDIGDRQRGRVKAKSIIECEPKCEKIFKAIEKLFSQDFQEKLSQVKNPYGFGGASKKIIETLENISFKNLLKKRFYDWPDR